MAPINGLTFLEEASRIIQSTNMLLTGQPDLSAALAAINTLEVFRFLLKPVSVEDLSLALQTAATDINLRRLRGISEVSLRSVQRSASRICYLDEELNVIFCNDAARAFLQKGDHLRLSEANRLVCGDLRRTRALHEFLKETRANAAQAGTRSIFHIETDDNPFSLLVSAMYHPPSGDAAGVVSVVISNPNLQSISTDELAAALRILPSEARVVKGLVDGNSVESASAAAGVSVSTARTYLKSIYQKTGVTRQAELVRLALLSVA
jgi:DNA-binding NarL/FixJ family response regulator